MMWLLENLLWKYMFSPSQYDLSACQHVSISAEGRSRIAPQEAGLVEFSQILIQI